MKGTFFKQPLEFSVEISGESFRQGESLKGVLLVRNHSDEEIDLEQFGVSLAQTDARKLKAKNQKGITDIKVLSFDAGEKLPAKCDKSLDWEFHLGTDSSISEKANGPYLFYGKTEEVFEGCHLQLKILPIEILEKYIEIFENFHRFKRKSIKYKKGFIEVLFTCPGGRDLGQIEKLTQHLRIIEGKLEVKWVFEINQLGYKDGSVEEKVEKVYEQLLEKKKDIWISETFLTKMAS